MTGRYAFLFLALTGSMLSAWQSQSEDVVFRSDVSLVRVDVQVLDRDRRALTGLRKEDFALSDEGRPQRIRNFASEEMPVDVLLLLDVSGSMRPHVERIASASHTAMQVLGENDRVGVMVFDRSTRVRLPFKNARGGDVERELGNLLKHEHFNGGTDITRGMIDAAQYVRRSARTEARRAIVILTDDETEFERDEARVLSELTRADAVMSALLVPFSMGNRGGGGWPRSGGGGGGVGGWPGSPPIILGPRGRGPMGGGRGPGGGGYGGSRTHTAGTAQIANESGGDSNQVDQASALEDTFARIRQRYALYFQLPAGARANQERALTISLAGDALRRYPYADLRYRHKYFSPSSVPQNGKDDGVTILGPVETSENTTSDPTQAPTVSRRRTAVQEGSTRVPQGPISTTTPTVEAPKSTDSTASATVAPPVDATPAPKKGGWRRVDQPSSTPAGPIKPETVDPPKTEKSDPDAPTMKRKN